MDVFRFNLFSCTIVVSSRMSRDHISSTLLPPSGPSIILYTMPHLNVSITDLACT